jgi:predicted nucleic acid-binding protein
LGGLQNVRIESSPDVVKALNWAAEGMDFADALHLTGMGEAERFVTFDPKLARRAKKLAAMHVSLA